MRNLSEGEAEEKLEGCDDGTFIIRKNRSTENIKFIISLRYGKQTRHVAIQEDSRGFYLGIDNDRQPFSSIWELITNAMSFAEPVDTDVLGFPVFITKNLRVMPTLKELCRCVIRPYVTVESVRLLGLPRTVAEWVAEGQHGKVSQGY